MSVVLKFPARFVKQAVAEPDWLWRHVPGVTNPVPPLPNWVEWINFNWSVVADEFVKRLVIDTSTGCSNETCLARLPWRRVVQRNHGNQRTCFAHFSAWLTSYANWLSQVECCNSRRSFIPIQLTLVDCNSIRIKDVDETRKNFHFSCTQETTEDRARDTHSRKNPAWKYRENIPNIWNNWIKSPQREVEFGRSGGNHGNR